MPEPTEPALVPALVTATTPQMLASGRPIAPGEEVDADLHADAALFATGALLRLPETLDALSRDELNARALVAGVQDPQKLPNKAEVVAAIRAANPSED